MHRVPDSTSSSTMTSRINTNRARLGVFEERIATGKRINRPSDDPSGAEMVLKLRTSQAEMMQFQRNAKAVSTRLTAADDALSSYQTMLDRVRTLMARGMSEVSTPETREAVAVELESLRTSMLSLANSVSGDEYVFGGTRQTAPPFDPATGNASATAAAPRYVQIEPGAPPVPTGVTAESVFGDSTATIFQDLNNAITALRGTGNAAADRATLTATMGRMTVYGSLAGSALARVGAHMNAAEIVMDNLTTNFLSLDEQATDIESADFAESALGLKRAETALDATLQVAARGKSNLFDFLR